MKRLVSFPAKGIEASFFGWEQLFIFGSSPKHLKGGYSAPLNQFNTQFDETACQPQLIVILLILKSI